MKRIFIQLFNNSYQLKKDKNFMNIWLVEYKIVNKINNNNKNEIIYDDVQFYYYIFTH